MPSRFLKQPNGKLARFSTIVDNFTHANLTRAEAVREAASEMGRRDAVAKVERGFARGLDAEGGWNECVETVRLVHGEEAAKAVVAEILGERKTKAP